MRYFKMKTVLKVFAPFCFIVFLFLYVISNILLDTDDHLSISALSNEPNCTVLYKKNADKEEIRIAENWMYSSSDLITEEKLTLDTQGNCKLFMKNRKYILTSNDWEEKNFGIAFTIVTFKDSVQVERLLRMIYRPWNYYCIHVDKKSPDSFFKAIDKLTKCLNDTFGNIVNTKIREDVRLGTKTVISADLNCMWELYNGYKKWKYLINLTGQEFPLKTNRELVQILKAYNGANNIEGTYVRRNSERIPKIVMPFPFTWYQGSVHITANREYLKFLFESSKAGTILDAIRQLFVPDVHYFSSINFNPHLRIPGSFIGDCEETPFPRQPRYYFLTRFKNYGEYSCLSGKIKNNICVWGVADLPKVVKAKHLFANKFYEYFQPATLRCLELWYYGKVRKETLARKVDINITFYKTLPFVVNQFRP